MVPEHRLLQKAINYLPPKNLPPPPPAPAPQQPPPDPAQVPITQVQPGQPGGLPAGLVNRIQSIFNVQTQNPQQTNGQNLQLQNGWGGKGRQ